MSGNSRIFLQRCRKVAALTCQLPSISKKTNGDNARLQERVRGLEAEKHSLARRERRLRVMCAEYAAIGVLFQLQTERLKAEIERLGKAKRVKRRKHLFY